ncbi:MAG: hypothetical protein IJM79_06610 [Erysipelotrichaceae bacterium]|nr:hypothetical protein [Erysipelotrichaceae bacterium]
MMKKLPPIEKIYEAYSAIADGRVNMHEHYAEVTSSDRTKDYIVTFNNRVYSSNDNGSYWQSYAGYPIIAVLMLQGLLSYDASTAMLFKNINWKKLNTQYKNRYSEAVKEIFRDLRNKGVDTDEVSRQVQGVYNELKRLDISLKKSSTKPNLKNGK